MRNLKYIFLLLAFLNYFNINACDKSFVTINYISETAPGVYEMQVDWCVGTTISAGGSGGDCAGVADGSTWEMGILLTGGSGINMTGFTPASLTSGETGNTGTGSIPVSNGVLYSTGSSAVLLHDGAGTSSPGQYCYSATITFTATTPPTSVQLRGLEDDCGASGAQVCSETVTVPAITPPATCLISGITAGAQTACDANNNTYSQTVTVIYTNNPGTGNLVINGQTFAITSSPQTETLTGLNSNGSPVNVTSYFSDEATCTYTANSLFSAPASCFTGCDFNTTQAVTVTPNGDGNTDPGFTQTYVLTDGNGLILVSNTTGNFGVQPFGEYFAYAVNYDDTDPPTTLPTVSNNVNDINDGCSGVSPSVRLAVCNTSTLESCENSGTDIVVALTPFTDDANLDNAVVIVDNETDNVVSIDNTDANGEVNYTTTSTTGDLLWGNYTVYSVNYDNTETLTSLGIIVGNTWPGNFGANCVDLQSAQIEVTAPASCIAGTSTLTACEDLSETISITSSGFNGNYDFDQFIIMVDSATNTITSIKWSNQDTDGIATFNTSGADSLPIGTYNAYAVNFEYLPGAAFYGLTVGATWPPTMSECIDTSAPAKVLVEDCTVLPIGLEYFTGKREEFNHLLRWKLGDIETLKSINLEYSINQKNFKSLKEFNDIKYSKESTYNNYKTNDGHNYYRLKMIYKDGSVLYSKLIDLNEKTNEPVFGLYPNPTTNHQFNITSNIEGAFNFVMTDVAGRVVMQLEMNFEIGSNNIVFIDESISKGVYVASIYSDIFPKKNIKVILD